MSIKMKAAYTVPPRDIYVHMYVCSCTRPLPEIYMYICMYVAAYTVPPRDIHVYMYICKYVCMYYIRIYIYILKKNLIKI